METLLCVNASFASFWPISVNAPFWNLVSGWKNPKTLPLCSLVYGESAYFAYQWRHRPAPRPLAFDLLHPRRLITTTTKTIADYMLVFVLQKILSLFGLRGQNILLLCHDIFVFFLYSVSSSTVCLYTARKLYVHAPSLLLCFWWIWSVTYRLEYEL